MSPPVHNFYTAVHVAGMAVSWLGRRLLCRNMVAEGCCATALMGEELLGRVAGGRGAFVLLYAAHTCT